MAAENQQQNDGEQIWNLDELNVGDEVITSKGDRMDVKPLEVIEVQEIDGTLSATIQGDWANAVKYELVNSDKFGITMPDVGIITVKRVSEAEPQADGGKETEPDITEATYSEMKELIDPIEGSRTVPSHQVEVEFTTKLYGKTETHTGVLMDFMGSRPGQRDSEESDWTLTVRTADGNSATIYQRPSTREGRSDPDNVARVIWHGAWGGTDHAMHGKVAVPDLEVRMDFDSPPICPVCGEEMFHAMTKHQPTGLNYDYNGLICPDCFPSSHYTEGIR